MEEPIQPYLWQYISHGTIIFDLVTSTLKFDLLLKNFTIGHNVQTRRDRAFILHMCILYDKTFHMVPWNLTFWPWHWGLTHLWKNLNRGCYLMMVAARRASLSSENSYFDIWQGLLFAQFRLISFMKEFHTHITTITLIQTFCFTSFHFQNCNYCKQ